MADKGRWELGLGKDSILNRTVREHLADDEKTSTQKPEGEQEGATQVWI